MVAAAVVTMRPGGRAEAPPAPHRGTFFAPDSVWNTPVPADAELDATSDVVVRELARQAAAGATINVGSYSTPVYTVPADQPTVTVRDIDDGFLNEPGPYSWGRVPLPPDARGAAGEDRHLVVWQPSTDTMWEFWRFSRTASGPQALHGARIDGVSRSDGSIPAPYGASASGIAVAAGMVTAQDLAAGSIDHALAIGIPETRADAFVAPATRTDGYVTRASAPVMGSRFRLDPSVDVDALGLPPLTRMVAHAAQRYGIVVRDRSGSVSFYGDDPVVTGTDPFTPVLAGGEMGEVMRTFPWQHIQLVAPGG